MLAHHHEHIAHGAGLVVVGSRVEEMLTLSGVFMTLTFVVFAGYGAFAAGVRTHVIHRPRVVTWMRRTFAATYVALAARMAVTAR